MTSPITRPLTKPLTYGLTAPLGTAMGEGAAAPLIFGPSQAAFVRLTDHGAATGLDWSNAASPAKMGYIRKNSAPGTVVNIRADEGAYTIDTGLHNLAAGFVGNSANRITVRGVDVSLAAMKAVFNGTRDASVTTKFTGGTTNASAVVTVADTSTLAVGMTVMANNLTYPSVILSISANVSVTLDKPATSTNASTTCIASPLLYRTDLETSGYDLFDLGTGASYVDFQNFTVNNMGSVFLPQCDLTDCTWTDIDCVNSFAVWNSESDTLGGNTVPIDTFSHTKLTFTRVTGLGYSSGFIRTWHKPKEIKLVACSGDAQKQIDVAFNIGVHFGGTGRLSSDPAYLAVNPGGGPTILGLTVKNHWYHSTASNFPNNIYWNADGLCDEDTIDGAYYKDVITIGNTDGGFDLKSSNCVVDNPDTEGNKFNFKFWGSGTVLGGKSVDPVKIGGSGAVGHISFFGARDINWTFNATTFTGTAGNSAILLDLESSAIGAMTATFISPTLSLQSGTQLVGTPTAPGTINVTGLPSGYNTESDTLFAAMAAGGNALSTTLKGDVDAAMTTLKSNGALTAMDLFYLWPATTVQDQALYNWVDPAAHKLVPTGGVVYDASAGFHGDLATGYLDSGLAANAATNYKQDDACIIVAVWDNVQRVIDSGAASSAMAKLVGRTSADLFLGRLNASTDKSIANTTGQGVFIINKLDATHYEFDINGVSTPVTASGSSALTANNFTPLRVSGAFAGTHRQGAYGVGKHLTAQQKLDVYNAIRTLARAVDPSLIP